MKVLIAEDDPLILGGLSEILKREGYEIVLARDGEEALALFEREKPDFVCLDIMMPELSGYDVCRRLRRVDTSVPIIFISARSEEVDKVLGLELGADDYILKPFGVKEVVARIRAVTRRYLLARPSGAPASSFSQVPFTLGDLTVFPSELRARRGETAIDLSPRDIQILELLHRRRGQVVDRDTFFNVCWGYDHLPNSRTLDQHISQLRKRIELDPKNPRLIRTVHGVGYRFDVEAG